jgi:hypothetical protein
VGTRPAMPDEDIIMRKQNQIDFLLRARRTE